MLLENKVIIVTGAATGIGLATSILLSDAGAKVVLAGRDAAALDEAKTRVVAKGGHALAVQGDISREADVAALVDAAVEEFGRLDGAFNNAGVGMHDKHFEDLSADEWDDVMSVNARAVFLCMKYQITAMKAGGGGAIVNNSSIEGMVGVPDWSEYTASKHAVNGLTRNASAEAGRTGVRVNAVLPGKIITPMTRARLDDPTQKEQVATSLARHSLGRFGRPEEVGHAVRWLLSDEASFVNGALLPVDGGYLAR